MHTCNARKICQASVSPFNHKDLTKKTPDILHVLTKPYAFHSPWLGNTEPYYRTMWNKKVAESQSSAPLPAPKQQTKSHLGAVISPPSRGQRPGRLSFAFLHSHII